MISEDSVVLLRVSLVKIDIEHQYYHILHELYHILLNVLEYLSSNHIQQTTVCILSIKRTEVERELSFLYIGAGKPQFWTEYQDPY
jgi:hypothetical protein